MKSLVPVTTHITSAARSRNAFLQFLHNYRLQQPACSRTPVTQIACQAGQAWARLPLNDKFFYIEAARNAGYVYKSRDRRMNRIMRHLRQSIACDDKCDLVQLSMAVKQMQLWKRRVLKGLC